jgi:hypothetical protein
MRTEIAHFEKVYSNLNLIVKDLNMKYDTYLKIKKNSPVDLVEEENKIVVIVIDNCFFIIVNYLDFYLL